jgi:hypothetical protein
MCPRIVSTCICARRIVLEATGGFETTVAAALAGADREEFYQELKSSYIEEATEDRDWWSMSYDDR